MPRFTRRARLTIHLIGIALLAIAQPALAQNQPYPVRPIRMICPSAAGGTLDIVTRAVALKLADSLGQPMVVENRPGVSTSIGEEAAARSKPDGYTLLMTGITLASSPYLRANLPFDPQKDFAPISLVATAGNVLVVNPSLAAKSVAELIQLSKSQSQPLFYGTPSFGSTGHLAAEMFNQAAGTRFQHIPYKGSAIAIQDLIAGQIQMTFDNIPVAIGHIRSGKLRALGVTSAQRSALLPDVPTIAESGLPGYQINAWFGMLAPAGTPSEILTRLHAETVKALATSDLKERFANLGFAPISNTPDEFRLFIQSEANRIGKVVKDAGIKPE